MAMQKLEERYGISHQDLSRLVEALPDIDMDKILNRFTLTDMTHVDCGFRLFKSNSTGALVCLVCEEVKNAI